MPCMHLDASISVQAMCSSCLAHPWVDTITNFEHCCVVPAPSPYSCRCAAAYNLHPFRAGCYPGTPVKAVQLERNNPAPPLWFRADVLQQLYTKRQFQQRMSISSVADALRQQITAAGRWADGVTAARWGSSLRTALNNFAALQVNCANPVHVGLPAEGLVSCDVCSQGHLNYLLDQGAVHTRHGVPVMGPGPPDLQQQQPSQDAPDDPQPSQHPDGDTSQQQSHAAPHETQHASQQQQQQQQRQQQEQQQPDVTQPQDPSQPQQQGDDLQQGRTQLQQNPLPAFSPCGAPLVIMYAVIDGLMRLTRLAKAGKWGAGGSGCLSAAVSTTHRAVGECSEGLVYNDAGVGATLCIASLAARRFVTKPTHSADGGSLLLLHPLFPLHPSLPSPPTPHPASCHFIGCWLLPSMPPSPLDTTPPSLPHPSTPSPSPSPSLCPSLLAFPFPLLLPLCSILPLSPHIFLALPPPPPIPLPAQSPIQASLPPSCPPHSLPSPPTSPLSFLLRSPCSPPPPPVPPAPLLSHASHSLPYPPVSTHTHPHPSLSFSPLFFSPIPIPHCAPPPLLQPRFLAPSPLMMSSCYRCLYVQAVLPPVRRTPPLASSLTATLTSTASSTPCHPGRGAGGPVGTLQPKPVTASMPTLP